MIDFAKLSFISLCLGIGWHIPEDLF